MQIVTHPETYLPAEAIGSKVSEYRSNFPIQGSLNAHYEYLLTRPLEQLVLLTAPGLLDNATGSTIEGWLWPADALKLYEMAYFASGDILELGTYQGLSTCIMAQAIRDAGRHSRIVTVDIHDYAPKLNLVRAGLSEIVDIRLGDASDQVKKLITQGRHFSFAFVDHSHRYGDVASVCPSLPSVLVPGSFIQFHDYSDSRNGVDPEYGVWQAVRDTLPAACQFCGIYGCSGLYRYQQPLL